ncbi:hypothetical protein GEMRC1_007339 [Eukaryota sp. GEM-RC1]
MSSSTETTSKQAIDDNLTDMDLGSIINTWSQQLQSDVQAFATAATKVEKWDEQIYANENNLKAIQDHIKQTEEQHKELQSVLAYITDDQNKLEQYIKELEESISSADTVQSKKDTKSDIDRKDVHKKAQSIASDLSSLSQEYTRVIERLNAVEPQLSEPMKQIGEILDYHNKLLIKLDKDSDGLQKEVESLDRNRLT